MMSSLEHRGAGLEAIDLEVGRLATLCGVSLPSSGVIEAILHDDSSVCRHANRIAWGKLRGLLYLRYHVFARSVEFDGYSVATEYLRQSSRHLGARPQPHGLA